jgi:hypothetical protein
MFMCVVNLESVNKLDLTWKQSFLIGWVHSYRDMLERIYTFFEQDRPSQCIVENSVH